MPLNPVQLAHGLRSQWLAGDGAPTPHSVEESADAFAGVVSTWFASAVAAGFPAATAAARRNQLANAMIPALTAGHPIATGVQTANAVASYIVGQSFGAGVAGAPAASPAAAPIIGAALADLERSVAARGAAIAGAIQMIAISTIVAFPSPPFAAPIL